MHECPHCHKLGISSFDAVGNLFSHGRVTCSYCHNTSRRRFRMGARIVPIIGGAALIAIAKTVHEMHYQLFAMVFVLFVMYIAIDDLITLEKVEVT